MITRFRVLAIVYIIYCNSGINEERIEITFIVFI